MKNDEFAFFNQQLAAMLRDGIPLEGALRRLCADMRHGSLRVELESLEADLARGTPLPQAVRARQLPELYKSLLEVGVLSNDLPGVLTLLADHYQRTNALWVRLKGLMVYPAMVLTAAFLLSCFLSGISLKLINSTFAGLGARLPLMTIIGPWISPVALGMVIILTIIILSNRGARNALRWRVPAFREAAWSQIASALAMLVKSGVPLETALTLVAQVESGTRAGPELTRWRQNLAAGRGKFSEMTAGGKVFPPLFGWLVSHAGEDLGAGFQKASEIFQARAIYRSDLLLYSALPCAVIGLGAMITLQVQPVFLALAAMINNLSGN